MIVSSLGKSFPAMIQSCQPWEMKCDYFIDYMWSTKIGNLLL